MPPPKPAKEIPTSVSKVDLTTGKETPEPGTWKIIPPAKHLCQICAVEHDPSAPHNAQSLYYQTAFHGMIGRTPTWADAMAHCPDELKKLWREALKDCGAWTEPPNGEEPVKHHGLDD